MSPQHEKDWIWVIAYINRDHIERVETDLLNHGYGAVRVYIPTVRILKKQFKNKNIYEYVPLLFNYGFFLIPFKKACDADFLINMRLKIPAVYSWVKDPIAVMKKKPKLRMDNKDPDLEEEEPKIKVLKKPKQTPKVAIAREVEIAELMKTSEHMSVFSDDIIDQLEVGSFIILRGYPYENMPAEIVAINQAQKKVKVRLLLETMMAEVMVHFENIFYTVYSDLKESGREKSLDEIGERSNRSLDKIYAQISYGED